MSFLKKCAAMLTKESTRGFANGITQRMKQMLRGEGGDTVDEPEREAIDELRDDKEPPNHERKKLSPDEKAIKKATLELQEGNVGKAIRALEDNSARADGRRSYGAPRSNGRCVPPR